MEAGGFAPFVDGETLFDGQPLRPHELGPVVHGAEGDGVVVFHLPEPGFDSVLRAVGGHDVAGAPVVAVGEQDPIAEDPILEPGSGPAVGAPGQAQFGGLCAGSSTGR